jgi:arylsulfatase
VDSTEDTGTPVIEDHADKMPFRFTGTLDRFVVNIGEKQDRSGQPARLVQRERREAAARE